MGYKIGVATAKQKAQIAKLLDKGVLVVCPKCDEKKPKAKPKAEKKKED